MLENSVDVSKCEVNEVEREQLRSLFKEFADCISFDDYDLGSYDHTVIDINTTTEQPPSKFRHARIPWKFQKEVEQHINKLLEAGRIRESTTPWVHPSVVVPKKNGSLRICLDLRSTNLVTVPDHFPLPRIDDLIAKVSGNRFFTSIDCASGYLQLKLSDAAARKCGWITHQGVYEFAYLPFGLKNAGAYFSRAMSKILSGLQDNCLFYLDDICVFSKTFPEHLDTLQKILERFRTFKLKISGKKFKEIARSKIVFLGHEISGNGYWPADRNLKSLKELQTPKTTRDVKRFLGMANFFRKFVPGFAKMATPLNELTTEKAKFQWGPSQNTAFEAIKSVLLSKPCLQFPADKEFILFTDGSKQAVGAALMQQSYPDQGLSAVGYFSKSLSASQQKWSPTHIELFAIVSALRFFKHITYGNHVKVMSDHKPLVFLLKHNKVHDNLARWVVELQSYDCTIEYIKGSANLVADCLSRAANPSVRFKDGTAEADDIIEFPIALSLLPEVFLIKADAKIRPRNVKLDQQTDPMCKRIMEQLDKDALAFDTDEAEADEIERTDMFVARNGCLYKSVTNKNNISRNLIVVPESSQRLIFEALHESPSSGGHFSWQKTLHKINRKYFWPGMQQQIRSWCKECPQCQFKLAKIKTKETLMPRKSDFIFQTVSVDITGPLKETPRGNKYLMAAICNFSKYVIVSPLQNCQAVTVASALVNDSILKYGMMQELVTDNAPYFTCELTKEIGRLLRISHYLVTPYHHEGNGAVERIFRTFHAMMRTYIKETQSDWDLFVQSCAFCYNTSMHSSIEESPFFMMFGRDPTFNIDLVLKHVDERHFPSDSEASEYKEILMKTLAETWRSASKANEKARTSFVKQHTKQFANTPASNIKPGDIVTFLNTSNKPGLSRKLLNPWAGTFRVIEVNKPHAMIVSRSSPNTTPRRVHLNQVKRFYEPSGPAVTPGALTAEDSKMMEEADSEKINTPGYATDDPPEAEPVTESEPTHRYALRSRSRLKETK